MEYGVGYITLILLVVEIFVGSMGQLRGDTLISGFFLDGSMKGGGMVFEGFTMYSGARMLCFSFIRL